MVLRGGGVDWCPPAPQNKCLHSSSWEAGAARSCYQPRLVFLSLSLSLDLMVRSPWAHALRVQCESELVLHLLLPGGCGCGGEGLLSAEVSGCAS